MSDHSEIAWTDATWNPTTGCTKVSPGCANCYIERTPPFRITGRKFDKKGHIPLQLHENRLEQPIRWRRPRMVFVNSLSDLFHVDVPFEFVDLVFGVMAVSSRHTFQVLTKRADRMQRYIESRAAGAGKEHLADAIQLAMDECSVHRYDLYGQQPGIAPYRWPLPNVWLIVSVENQPMVDARIPELLATRAAVRGISAEPLLEEIDITPHLHGDTLAAPGPGGFRKGPALDWVIVGVEKVAGGRVGRNAAAYEEHARAVLEQCADAGVAAFHKQMPIRGRVSGEPSEWGADLRVREFPKAAAC